MKPWRLFHCADPAWFSDNPLGLLPKAVEKGWEAAFAEPPWAGAPSLDETIDAGWSWCLSRPYGNYAQDVVVGKYPGAYPGVGGKPVVCTPRGPECFAAMNALTGGGLVTAARKRADWLRSKGRESSVYLGLPSIAAYPATLSAAKRDALNDSWLAPIIDGGFGGVMGDAFGACSQKSKTRGMHFAERCLKRGLWFAGECTEVVTPELFPNFNGRFGCVTMLSNERARAGSGWFNRDCKDVVTRRFLWLQGSVPVQERMAEAEGTKAEPIVELGGLPESWWKGVGAG